MGTDGMVQFELEGVRKYVAFVERIPDLGPNAVAAIFKEHGGCAPDANNLHPDRYNAVALALIKARDDYVHREKLRRENRWRLSIDHPLFVEATKALDLDWRHGQKLGDYEKAKKYMLERLAKYEAAGVTSRKTRGELYAVLKEAFQQ
jgi:hypothetical protein